MHRVEEKFIDTMKRLDFLFKNEVIITECVKNYDGMNISGEKFGPFIKGNKYRMPLFEALPFIEHDILKIENSVKCDNVSVQRYAIAERDDQRLIKQDRKLFLFMIKQFKKFMEKQVAERAIPQDFLDKYNSYFSNLLDMRLLKVLRLTKTKLNPSDKQRLTLSENLLFKRIYSLLKTWKNVLLEKEMGRN